MRESFRQIEYPGEGICGETEALFGAADRGHPKDETMTRYALNLRMSETNALRTQSALVNEFNRDFALVDAMPITLDRPMLLNLIGLA